MSARTPTYRELLLEAFVRKTWWMARRYAHNRSTYAVEMYNDMIAGAIDAGIDIQPLEADGTVWAKDGMFGWPKTLIAKYGRHNAEVAEAFR